MQAVTACPVTLAAASGTCYKPPPGEPAVPGTVRSGGGRARDRTPRPRRPRQAVPRRLHLPGKLPAPAPRRCGFRPGRTPPQAEGQRPPAGAPLPGMARIWPAQVAISAVLCATGGLVILGGNQPAPIRQRGHADGHRESRTGPLPGAGAGCQPARLRGARPQPCHALAGRDRPGSGQRGGVPGIAVAAPVHPVPPLCRHRHHQPGSSPGRGRSAANAAAAGWFPGSAR